VISQLTRELKGIGATDLIGTVIVVAIVRELGPLLTALVVVGRSGTAIAAELATNQVMGEVRALEFMGIDPKQYLVLPRFVAARFNGLPGPRYFQIVLESLTNHDVWLTIFKALAFGAIVGVVPSYFGLAVRRASTEIPIAASRAVVAALVGIFLCSALFVALG